MKYGIKSKLLTLVEMAFISNDKEEKLMNSEAGINRAAEGILNGLRRFFS